MIKKIQERKLFLLACLVFGSSAVMASNEKDLSFLNSEKTILNSEKTNLFKSAFNLNDNAEKNLNNNSLNKSSYENKTSVKIDATRGNKDIKEIMDSFRKPAANTNNNGIKDVLDGNTAFFQKKLEESKKTIEIYKKEISEAKEKLSSQAKEMEYLKAEISKLSSQAKEMESLKAEIAEIENFYNAKQDAFMVEIALRKTEEEENHKREIEELHSFYKNSKKPTTEEK
jgi:hypothetical protein